MLITQLVYKPRLLFYGTTRWPSYSTSLFHSLHATCSKAPRIRCIKHELSLCQCVCVFTHWQLRCVARCGAAIACQRQKFKVDALWQQQATANNINNSNNKQWQHLLRNKSQTVQCDMSNALMPAPDYDGTLGKRVRIWGRKSVCCAIYVSVCLYYIYTICVLCVFLYCVLSIAWQKRR